MKIYRLIAALAFCSLAGLPNTHAIEDGVSSRGDRDEITPKLFKGLPVKEITVFKDGHALVLHEGEMPVDESGNVVWDFLPVPVLGTFWPYSADPDAELTAVVTGRNKIKVQKTALNLRELLEANVGAKVLIKETSQKSYEAKILEIPFRSSEELERTNIDRPHTILPLKGDVILLETPEGTKVFPISRIQEITFLNSPKSKVTQEEFRNLLTMKLDWKGKRPKKMVRVGLAYLQKGFRWIPNYKININGKGKAKVKLQATLLNELVDVEKAKLHLVIGVPTFAFKDTPDPISLQNTFARLSQYFDSSSQTAYAMSNAIATQVRMSEYRTHSRPPESGSGTLDLGPEIAGGSKSEDLFIFTVQNVTLKNGERMVLPVTEFTLGYEDVFTLELFFSPPKEVFRGFNNQQQAELARLFHSPKAIHKIRLKNDSQQPLTTGPAMIFHNGQILSQGLLTYTAIGGSTDLEITKAVDIKVKKKEIEGKRDPKAVRWNGHDYARVDFNGTITLTNYQTKPAKLEVSRYTLGVVDNVGQDGKVEKLNVLEGDEFTYFGRYPRWYGWYNWPNWWHRFNGTSRITWETTLEPGKKVDLKYAYHYFWR